MGSDVTKVPVQLHVSRGFGKKTHAVLTTPYILNISLLLLRVISS